MKSTMFFIMVLLALPVQAQADWSGAGAHPIAGPNFTAPPQRIEPQHRDTPHQHVQPVQPVHHYVPPVENRAQSVRHDRPSNHQFYRNEGFFSQENDNFPYVTVSPTIDLPDGLVTIVVDGQTFFYNDGIFYQEVGGQLTVIPPVLGAVVDSIPQDYQIVMADGVNYFFAEGVYYQRVTDGFEVVQFPVSDQE